MTDCTRKTCWMAERAPRWLSFLYFYAYCFPAYLAVVYGLPTGNRVWTFMLPAAGVWAYTERGHREWIEEWRT